MTQERIKEIVAILDRAKQYQGVNYALEHAVNELIREVQALTEKLNTEQRVSDYLRSPEQKGNW